MILWDQKNSNVLMSCFDSIEKQQAAAQEALWVRTVISKYKGQIMCPNLFKDTNILVLLRKTLMFWCRALIPDEKSSKLRRKKPYELGRSSRRPKAIIGYFLGTKKEPEKCPSVVGTGVLVRTSCCWDKLIGFVVW